MGGTRFGSEWIPVKFYCIFLYDLADLARVATDLIRHAIKKKQTMATRPRIGCLLDSLRAETRTMGVRISVGDFIAFFMTITMQCMDGRHT